MPAKLILVATPIGNLGDLSPRAAETLTAADFWIVEDTRQSAKLQATLNVKKRMVVLNDHSPESRYLSLLREIEDAETVALITDAGCPGISDPGAHLADLCYDAGEVVDAIPGPSAVTTALMLSGYYAQRFAFLGYLPRKAGAVRKELEGFADSPLTIVLFESPFRAKNLIETAYSALGERRYTICREISKLHQQVFRSTLPSVPSQQQVPEKGEWTLVIEGKRKVGHDVGVR